MRKWKAEKTSMRWMVVWYTFGRGGMRLNALSSWKRGMRCWQKDSLRMHCVFWVLEWQVSLSVASSARSLWALKIPSVGGQQALGLQRKPC
jgi:hypothetical protein